MTIDYTGVYNFQQTNKTDLKLFMSIQHRVRSSPPLTDVTKGLYD